MITESDVEDLIVTITEVQDHVTNARAIHKETDDMLHGLKRKLDCLDLEEDEGCPVCEIVRDFLGLTPPQWATAIHTNNLAKLLKDRT